MRDATRVGRDRLQACGRALHKGIGEVRAEDAIARERSAKAVAHLQLYRDEAQPY